MAKLLDIKLALTALTALIFYEEEEAEHKMKERKWKHDAQKKRESEGKFAPQYKELIDDGAKFFQIQVSLAICWFTI